MRCSVILCSYNPERQILRQAIQSLAKQTLESEKWELLLVDNRSDPPIGGDQLEPITARAKVSVETRQGLAFARRTGLRLAKGDIYIFLDDDNLPDPDYLTFALEFMDANPGVGAVGGKVIGEYAASIPAWVEEFEPLLAIRDHGDQTLISEGPPDQPYPLFSPIGAGMVIRSAAIQTWLERETQFSDRSGADLSSAGDCDMMFSILRSGWQLAYAPDLRLKHLIPEFRLRPAYLGRLNRGIQRSWVRLLRSYDASPWSPIPRWTLIPRKARAWVRHQAWRGGPHWIRWQGTVGHFEGLTGTLQAQA